MKQEPSIGAPSIKLTVAVNTDDHQEGGSIRVHTAELIAYDQQLDFTRLVLKGRRTLHVKERTDQIDHLIRTAAAHLLTT